MSKRSDAAAQGIISGRKAIGAVIPVARPDGKRIIRNAGNAVARKDAADHTNRKPPERATQNWRRG